MTGPLLVTCDPLAHEELVRVAAVAGLSVEVRSDLTAVRREWDRAPLVVLGEDVLPGVVAGRPQRREGVVVLAQDRDDAGVWHRAVDVGAERVLFLPDDERWLVEALADAAEGRAGRGALVAVVGGRGGAGATTLACALAHAAARGGSRPMLVDGDPLGGGLDVVFRAEGTTGLRWPDLVGSRGRVPAAALAAGLPTVDGVTLLSWDRSATVAVPVEAMRAVLAAGRRAHDLVVVDLPRHLGDLGREVCLAAQVVLLVVPAEVRASAAAARVAAEVSGLCSDVRLVVRGPSPSGLGARELASALGLPLAAELKPEPRLAQALEEGVVPGVRRGSPLGAAAQTLLGALLQDEPTALRDRAA